MGETGHYYLGLTHDTVYPLICGFETDEDAILLHGAHGEILNMAELSDADRDGLMPRLTQLFPDMPAQVRADLLPLLLGNLDHIAQLRQTERTLASAPYDEIGVDRARAEPKAHFMSDFAASVIRAERPALAAKMSQRTCVLHWGRRVLTVIPS